VRGRQYVLTIFLSVIFGALSGAAMAVAAMMSRSLYPTMIARGYNPRLSMGAILAGASLAPIIPPSVLVIIIATLADISVAKLLIAGIVPGLILAAVFLIYIIVLVSLDPKLAPEEPGPRLKVALLEKLVAVGQMVPFSIIIFLVIGFILQDSLRSARLRRLHYQHDYRDRRELQHVRAAARDHRLHRTIGRLRQQPHRRSLQSALSDDADRLRAVHVH
jgi:TRAP-type mannitol/chloroaromatic compound transport system permease large subunit